jgi:Flp pilus assembly protein TadG
VEFALLLPIFVLLVFGVISAGLSLWKHNTDVQAARDAARYGSTLPISPTGTDTNCDSTTLSKAGFLACVQSIAVKEAGWPDVASVGAQDNGYVCVAYVKDTTTAGAGAQVTSGRLLAGNPTSDDPTPTVDANSCYDDGRPDGRVQVYIRRDGRFDAVFYARTWNMNTRSSIPYERGAP